MEGFLRELCFEETTDGAPRKSEDKREKVALGSRSKRAESWEC